MICPNCHQPVEDGAFCPYCRMRLTPPAPPVQPLYPAPQPVGNPQPPKKKKTALIAGIAAAAVVVIATVVLLIVLLGKDSDDKTKDNNSGADRNAQVSTEATLPAFTLPAPTQAATEAPEEEPTEAFRAGFVILEDENTAYDKNFIEAAKEVCAELGVDYYIQMNISESAECYDAACELIDDGCGFIFANSYGHEDYLIQAARENPNVEFAHASGARAHTEGLSNFHNAYASIYEGRYLAGVAAGMKLNEMIDTGKITAKEAKIGYVGAYTYAEVISDYTAFFLGARSVCPSAAMEVRFTGRWDDYFAEQEAAVALIQNKCVLISQHGDSLGAPTACEEAGVPNIAYNGSNISACPDTFIVSSQIDWKPYFRYAIQAAMNGRSFDTDWTGTLATGSVVLSEVNDKAAAPGTAAKLKEVATALESGALHVFDTDTFTVDGKKLLSYRADVDYDDMYEPDTEAISYGYFHECEYRSAPYFDIQIDGITLVGVAY